MKFPPHENKEKIQEAIKEGNKREWIAAVYECSTMTVTRYAKELGLTKVQYRNKRYVK